MLSSVPPVPDRVHPVLHCVSVAAWQTLATCVLVWKTKGPTVSSFIPLHFCSVTFALRSVVEFVHRSLCFICLVKKKPQCSGKRHCSLCAAAVWWRFTFTLRLLPEPFTVNYCTKRFSLAHVIEGFSKLVCIKFNSSRSELQLLTHSRERSEWRVKEEDHSPSPLLKLI